MLERKSDVEVTWKVDKMVKIKSTLSYCTSFPTIIKLGHIFAPTGAAEPHLQYVMPPFLMSKLTRTAFDDVTSQLIAQNN
jgi:hypothetical protein